MGLRYETFAVAALPAGRRTAYRAVHLVGAAGESSRRLVTVDHLGRGEQRLGELRCLDRCQFDRLVDVRFEAVDMELDDRIAVEAAVGSCACLLYTSWRLDVPDPLIPTRIRRAAQHLLPSLVSFATGCDNGQLCVPPGST